MKETWGRVCKKVEVSSVGLIVARKGIVIWCKKHSSLRYYFTGMNLIGERFVKIGVRVIRIVFTTIQI